MRERELKPGGQLGRNGRRRSLPMRERELKLDAEWRVAKGAKSLPMRERELKLAGLGCADHPGVAPHAGA